MRGEYPSRKEFSNSQPELPPRARRIRLIEQARGFVRGTTSACAENTARFKSRVPGSENYLRVRGEYSCVLPLRYVRLELPPRARRIQSYPAKPHGCHGTTSACAENTCIHVATSVCEWNYLRVRGEYIVRMIRVAEGIELPPRARRIRS